MYFCASLTASNGLAGGRAGDGFDTGAGVSLAAAAPAEAAIAAPGAATGAAVGSACVESVAPGAGAGAGAFVEELASGVAPALELPLSAVVGARLAGVAPPAGEFTLVPAGVPACGAAAADPVVGWGGVAAGWLAFVVAVGGVVPVVAFSPALALLPSVGCVVVKGLFALNPSHPNP